MKCNQLSEIKRILTTGRFISYCASLLADLLMVVVTLELRSKWCASPFAESFRNIPRWLREMRDYADDNIVVMLVGNKCDLRHLRTVETEDVEAYCKEQGLFFIETSALDCTNVEKAFRQLLTEVHHKISKSVMSAGDERSLKVRMMQVASWRVWRGGGGAGKWKRTNSARVKPQSERR